MGKNKRRQLSCYDSFHKIQLNCDSVEECDFIEWCSEAASLKIIKDFIYQPESIKLFDAVSYLDFQGKKKSLLRDHVYSPDFCIIFDPGTFLILAKQFKIPYDQVSLNESSVYLDVKGTFQRNGGDRSFSLNQKWVFQKTGIYVSKIIPENFFKECGCPQACFLSKKLKKARKKFIGFKTIAQAFRLETKNAAL